MLIRQHDYCIGMCLRLATIKSKISKICSFTVLWGSRGVWKPVSIWCDHHLPSPSHRVDQVVDCGLLNVGPLLFNAWAKLLDIGRNWNTLLFTPIQSIPNMLNGWRVRWVCWPFKNWDVFSFQELCTDPCNIGPCIIMLQHEVMVMDEWHNNVPQDLVTVSLCIQNAINKMHLCSLSITYACPYHNPTATMGHSIHNIDISKPLPYTTPYSLFTFCPVQGKPGLIHEENTSPKCQTPSNVSICHSSWLRWRTAVRPRPRWACRWASLRRFLTVCAEILWLCKPIVAAAVRVAGLGRSWRWRCWMWRSWAGVVTCGLVCGCKTKFSETPLETAYGREMNIQFMGNSSGGHCCSQNANCTLLQNLQHLWHCAVW